MNPYAVGALFREATPCPEMLSVHSEPAIEVTQVTSDPNHDVHCAAMHSSFALFTPDSRRCVLERQNGLGRGSDWKMEFLLCDLEDSFSLRLLTDEARVRGPVLSRDGRVLYYWDDLTGADKPRLVFKQIDLDTFRRDTLLAIDSPVDGLGRAPRGGRMYDMSSLRRDGKRLRWSSDFSTAQTPNRIGGSTANGPMVACGLTGTNDTPEANPCPITPCQTSRYFPRGHVSGNPSETSKPAVNQGIIALGAMLAVALNVRGNRNDDRARKLLEDVALKDPRPDWSDWARWRLALMGGGASTGDRAAPTTRPVFTPAGRP